MENRLFRVNKPCVIEAKYCEANSYYHPSKKMSDIALNELLEHEFLTEFIPVKINKSDVKEDIYSCLDSVTEDIDTILAKYKDLSSYTIGTIACRMKDGLTTVKELVGQQL